MAAENDCKKRKRRFLPHNKAPKKKGPTPLRPGIQGFFITSDGGREHQASQEAIHVIESFFEELIHGKDSSAGTAAIPKKPMNKKITFSYSDSSDNEDDDDEASEEENQSEKLTEDGLNNGITVEKNSDLVKKDDQLHDAESGQAADHDEVEVGKQADDKNDSNVENSDPAKKDDDKLHEAGSGQAVGDDDEEVGKQADDRNGSKVDEEPPEKKQCCDNKKFESRNHNVETSVDKLIEAELKELGDKSKRRFFKLDSGCNGVVLVQMRRREGDPSPTDIVQHMMESASATKKHMSRFLLRVLPIEVSCYASDEEITRAIKPLVEQYFPADIEAPIKFAVQYDARANSGIERMKIIDAVAKSVPGPHKVDLKNPEKTIIVQVVKTVCLISVVEKYKEFAKYNLRQLTSP